MMMFRGKYDFLSNFYPCNVTLAMRDGKEHTFKNSEAAFQAFKASDSAAISKFERMDGRTAKMAGKKVKLCCTAEEWNAQRLDVMKKVVTAKFQQNPELAEKLLAVDEPIEEGNNWNDRFWGVCTSKKTGKKTGSNHLGIILEQIKTELSN